MKRINKQEAADAVFLARLNLWQAGVLWGGPNALSKLNESKYEGAIYVIQEIAEEKVFEAFQNYRACG